jgi:hypothetical protein
VELGDFDGDGILDVGVGQKERTILIFKGDRSGNLSLYSEIDFNLDYRPRRPNFSDRGPSNALRFQLTSMDIDNDGDLDIIARNDDKSNYPDWSGDPYDLNNFVVFYNGGFQNFGNGSQWQTQVYDVPNDMHTIKVSQGLVATDVDGNGIVDVVITSIPYPRRPIYENALYHNMGVFYGYPL